MRVEKKSATFSLILTHCENICLLNYANVAKVVSTSCLMRGKAQL